MLRTVAPIAAAILAAAAVAACGGAGSNTTSASTNAAAAGGSRSGEAVPRTAATAPNAGLRFSECMRSHGVRSYPDPGTGGAGGVADQVQLNLAYLQVTASRTPGSSTTMTVNGASVSAPAFRAATQACQKDLSRRPPSAPQIAQFKSKAIAFARCMRAHGVRSYPDPQVVIGPSGRAIGVRIGWGPTPNSAIERHSPAFQHAGQKCGGLLPQAVGIRGGPPAADG